MKKIIQTIALLVCSFCPPMANPAAQQLLVAAKQQASLFHNEGSPFQLDIDFVLQMHVPAQGHMTLKWGGKDRWWRKIVMQGFEQVEIRNGDRRYTSRNVGFTPLHIKELISLVEFAESSEPFAVKKQKRHVENGVEITYLQVSRKGVNTQPHEVRLNPASHEILSDEWSDVPDGRRRQEYSDYLDFTGRHYPRELQLVENGRVIISANVQNVAATTFDDGLLLPPTRAIERRQCDGMKYPKAVKTPEPEYPRSNRENRLIGDTTVAMTVMADGSVDNIQLIGRSTPDMDNATLQTLKGWKFKPAMCGSEPVVSDIEVVVSFRSYN
jgi:TonB family protein